jgi:hypothetical protein
LYSLGVTLWEMVTGHVMFRGSPAEVMYQHQHERLPVEQLKDAPEPVVVLLEALLEKDPARRFQNPTELLKAMPTVTEAIETRRRITRESLQKTPSIASRVGPRKPPTRLAPDKISLARLPVTGSEIFGREEDITFLDRAWAKKEVNVVTIVAWAGVGKSTLVNHWFWMVWSRFKIRPVHMRDGCAILPSRRCCVNSLHSIRGFVSLPLAYLSPILRITNAPQPCAVNWTNYRAMLVRSYSGRWALRGMRSSCEPPATSSVAIAWRYPCWAAIWLMHTKAIFGIGKNCQNVSLTTCDMEHMPEK